MRHPEKGSVKLASEYMSVPIINAGDGAGEHPTQVKILKIYISFFLYLKKMTFYL